MKKRMKLRRKSLLLTSLLLLPIGHGTSALAASPSPSPSAKAAHSETRIHGLSAAQQAAIAAAKLTYQSAVQSALDGANKAIADARSIRDQALAAAGKDVNVRKLANSDFMNSSAQIWGVFKTSVAAAKGTFDSTVTAIKSGEAPTTK
jgi:hypothetical protein